MQVVKFTWKVGRNKLCAVTANLIHNAAPQRSTRVRPRGYSNSSSLMAQATANDDAKT